MEITDFYEYDSRLVEFSWADVTTDVDDYGDELPDRFRLYQNFPNPFNVSTTINYYLPQRSHVTIDIFNLLGQRVRTLVDEEKPAGSYTASWDGTSTGGQSVATGVYLYRIWAGNRIETRKMLLLK